MKFQPKSKKELELAGLLEKGPYPFEVIEASGAKSKSGNDMIKLKVHVFPKDPDAKPRIIFDYLLEAMEFKLAHFCEAVGIFHKYEEGGLQAEDCAGRTGTCYISVKIDKSGEYPTKNEITDYVVDKSKRPEAPAKSAPLPNDLESEDIPF